MTRTKPRLTYTHRCAHGAPTQSARARAQVAAEGGRLHTCRRRTAPHACSTYLTLAARITTVKSRHMCVGELLETLLHRRSTVRARENQERNHPNDHCACKCAASVRVLGVPAAPEKRSRSGPSIPRARPVAGDEHKRAEKEREHRTLQRFIIRSRSHESCLSGRFC